MGGVKKTGSIGFNEETLRYAQGDRVIAAPLLCLPDQHFHDLPGIGLAVGVIGDDADLVR
jgi:hypothetical protein